MCGIAGIRHLEGAPIDPLDVERMCGLLAHRGPDGSAFWNSQGISLGHRRLSIIDLTERGQNPMPNEDGTLFLVCNGEIYNYRELRAQLLSSGHRFRSETDTEVILHLYEEEGPSFVKKLNGMFAFVLWDVKKQTLFLARDRFGVKPLYYTRTGKRFLFASEIKAFLGCSDFHPALDPFSLSEHFSFQNTFGTRTFFKDVQLLPAGHTLTVKDDSVSISEYWDLEFEVHDKGSLEDWAHGVRERFEVSVKRQLMSDVPVGSYLSGGMDTGSISAVASRFIPDLHTFTCGFDLPAQATEWESYFDESAESFSLAAKLGTRHHEIKLGPDAMAAVLQRVVWHLDEPRVGISYQVYYTAEMIRKYVTVVLSGVGGDELFAGYPWRYEPILELREESFDSVYYALWTRLLGDEEKKGLWSRDFSARLEGYSSFESFRSALARARGMEPLERALYFDFKTFLNGLLIVDDKLSMAHSVEARVPFLDNDLVDYVRRIPASFKLNVGESKKVLKKAMSGLLPEETLNRRKQGFTPPHETWYKKDMSFVRELILSSRAKERGYFQPETIERFLGEHSSGKKNHRFLIWSLMCFEWWNRLFIDREALTRSGDHSVLGVRSS